MLSFLASGLKKYVDIHMTITKNVPNYKKKGLKLDNVLSIAPKSRETRRKIKLMRKE